VNQPAVDRPLGRPRSAGVVILLTIVTLGIWTWVWSFQNAREMKAYRGQGLGGGLTLLLAILVFPVVWFTLAWEMEKLYEEASERPPITAIWGLWFLLPIIGNFVWYLRMQRSLNEFWTARGAIA
jgi:Domain of unknown function (DUF4234)